MKRATTITATYRIVTPMFCAGADQNSAELRMPSFKGALRFWWRTLQWSEIQNAGKLQRKEAEIFGSSDKNFGQSKARMRFVSKEPGEKIKKGDKLCDGDGRGLAYLGYGVMKPNGTLTRPAIKDGQFTIQCRISPTATECVVPGVSQALTALGTYGGLGSKSRKGYGSLQLTELIGSQPSMQTIDKSISGETPGWTAFSNASRVVKVARPGSASDALNWAGNQLATFRLWQNTEENSRFPADHHALYWYLKDGKSMSRPPARVAFGLPHNYFFRSLSETRTDPKKFIRAEVTPSLPNKFLAATPWLKQIENDPDRKRKADAHAKLAVSKGNYSNSEQPAAHKIGVTWAKVDGPVWFKSAIRNDEPGKEKDRKTKTDHKSNPRKGIINDLLTSLKNTYSDPNGNKDQPIPFYAIVLMDGDQMGKLLNALNTPQELSQGLVEFNQRVEKIINSHDGRTVYAGGDDVLALLPAKDALKAADNIRRAYQDSFKVHGVEDNLATISAAVVYSHWKYPLRLALQTAHHLLDDVAKNQTGRDAVAIGTILSSGLNAVWSVPWDVYLGNARGSHSLELLLDHFDHNDNNESTTPAFNASYLYLLRDRFAQLLDDVRDEPGEFASFEAADSGNNLLIDLAHAEYRRRMSRAALKNTPPEKTQPLISQLMSLTWKWTRQTAQGSLANIEPDRTTFCFDGWRVARLLKQIEDGRAVDHD